MVSVSDLLHASAFTSVFIIDFGAIYFFFLVSEIGIFTVVNSALVIGVIKCASV